MKAAVYERYGPPEVVTIRDVPKPTPGERDILIRTVATTVNSGDWRVRSLGVPTGFGLISRLVFGLHRPKQPILGMEVSGVVEAVGPGVTRFAVGDEVFSFDGAGMAGHAEYKCLSEDKPIARKPANISHQEAAALSFGGTTALDFYRRARLQSGERVLVNGASGTVGLAAVQLARHFGAHVTGVCSTGNRELVQSLGADRVIDYTQEDFTRVGESWHVIVDTAGTAPHSRSKAALADAGRLLLVLGGMPSLLAIPWINLTTRHQVIGGPAAERADDVRILAELAEAGQYRAVIDRTYPFEEIVEAHRHVDTGHKKGSVVVTVARQP